MLLYAVIFINLALVSYTIGVWSEKISGTLRARHLIFFWAGLVFDTVGTMFMEQLNTHHVINLHGITGMTALVLMLVHAVWASIVLWKRKEEKMKQFHRFSLIVWAIWLIPYLIGVALSIFK